MKNEKYCAAVASVSWLTDAAYPLRVHTVFLRFPNFELSQKSRLGLLAKLCGVAINNGCACNDICRRTHFHYRLYLYVVAPVGLDISFVAEGLWSGVGAGD